MCLRIDRAASGLHQLKRILKTNIQCIASRSSWRSTRCAASIARSHLCFRLASFPYVSDRVAPDPT